MHLGLIGGIGPAATVAYYERLSPVFSGRRHGLTIAQADMEALLANAAANDHAAQVDAYLPLIAQLDRAGAEAVAITSITGSFCLDALSAASPLPLISIFEALNDVFQSEGITRVGVLGGTGVMASRVYDKLEATVIIPGDDLAELGALYFELARTAQCTPAQRDRFFAAGADLMAQGAEVVVLGGTDLGLAFGGHEAGYPVLDAVDVHVARMVNMVETQ